MLAPAIEGARCTRGMVVAPHVASAEAGLTALRAGGNAFDAIVAAAFANCVVEPAHNGIGGYGGHMVAWHAGEGRVVCLDYNTRAPMAASPTMFPVVPDPETVYRVPGRVHLFGGLSVGVPGVVAGLAEIHARWGTLPLGTLLGPAIALAQEGFEIHFATSTALAGHQAAIERDFPETAALLYPKGELRGKGDRLAFPDLAHTLERLVAAGPRDFYEGELARRIVAAVRAAGGILTEADMAAYRARLVTPVRFPYHGYEIYTPPPGAGGVTTCQILAALDRLPLDGIRPGEPEFYRVYVAALKPCWRRRVAEIGDPEFTGRSGAEQLEESVIAAIVREAQADLAAPDPGRKCAPDAFHCTAHLCAADSAGNFVSLTQTHGGLWGSYLAVPGAGFVLGHGMARFDPRPGWPNSIAPGKSPLHNMAPILVLRDGAPYAVYGTPGGRTIVNNQALFSLCLLRYGMSLAETFALPRLHCEEAEPAELEPTAGEGVFSALRKAGVQVREREPFGCAAGIVRTGDRFTGSAEPRRDGAAAWE